MRRNQQPFLIGFEKLGKREFGGNLNPAKGNPRDQRPLSLKRPLHLVLRSTLATGEMSFLRPVRSRRIEKLVRELGKRLDVRVYRFANSGNHLHLVVLPRSRKAFRAYTRAVTGLIARITLGVERGKGRKIKFWDARPYTRIIEWGREFRVVSQYVVQNTLEALGFIPYQPRNHKTKLQRAGA